MIRRRTVLGFLLLFSATAATAQNGPAREKAIVLKRMIELNHLAPRPVDDSFSVGLFNSVLRSADRKELLFTQPEYQALSAFSTRLDDELQGKEWAFLDLFTAKYKVALQRADSIVTNLLQKPFDFSADEWLSASADQQFHFAKDVPALTDRWKRYLKYKLLDQLFEIAQADSTQKATLKDITAHAEAQVRERVKTSEIKALKKMMDPADGFAGFVTDIYLNAVAEAFDPHTNYFSMKEKEKFRAELSTESLSFGVNLGENESGEIVIEKLVPGGPAWKSGDMNEGDELLSLQWEGKEAVKMAGLDLEEAYEILEQSVDERLVFEYRKSDGTRRTTLLKKEKIENEENIVKSFLLKGEKKIGYIVLPAFYTKWENESGSSCANDVAREIVRLKRENIDGLVLDVRFNGGGSLAEAMEMIGIFVDEGPLMGQVQKAGKLHYLKDPNRGTIYTGPLALMVNGQSASASELLAAALQDYNRALIVGSNTYGKATMQQMMALDTNTSRPTQVSRLKDMVKITTGKLYRLSGETAQLNGVVPDVVLPDAFDGLDYRERFSPYALAGDKVAKNNYYRPLPSLPVSTLAKMSNERLGKDKNFQDIKSLAQALRDRRAKMARLPLKTEAFEQWARQRENEFNLFKGYNNFPQEKYKVDNHEADKKALTASNYAAELNAGWIRDIANDIYIREAYTILCDFINLQSTKN